jgi:hypothetical protein
MSTKNEQLPEQPKNQNDGKQTQPTPKSNMFKLEKTTIAKLGKGGVENVKLKGASGDAMCMSDNIICPERS